MVYAGSKPPLSVRTPGRYSPLGCGAGVGPKAEVLLGASFRNGLLCSEHKICVEREVEGASGRGDGLSDGEFWGTNKAGFGASLMWEVVGWTERSANEGLWAQW